MKIIKHNLPTTSFECLCEGQVFLKDQEYVFMKIYPVAPGYPNAVNLETGDCDWFLPTDIVTLVEATLTLEEKKG